MSARLLAAVGMASAVAVGGGSAQADDSPVETPSAPAPSSSPTQEAPTSPTTPPPKEEDSSSAGMSGESCTKTADCAKGLRCISQVCIDPKIGEVGDDCEKSSDCNSHLRCKAGTCKPPSAKPESSSPGATKTSAAVSASLGTPPELPPDTVPARADDEVALGGRLGIGAGFQGWEPKNGGLTATGGGYSLAAAVGMRISRHLSLYFVDLQYARALVSQVSKELPAKYLALGAAMRLAFNPRFGSVYLSVSWANSAIGDAPRQSGVMLGVESLFHLTGALHLGVAYNSLLFDPYGVNSVSAMLVLMR